MGEEYVPYKTDLLTYTDRPSYLKPELTTYLLLTLNLPDTSQLMTKYSCNTEYGIINIYELLHCMDGHDT